MNASLIDEFHLQFQRIVEELKQSFGKELEKKATELYALFLYHLSAAYNPGFASGRMQIHQFPSSLASPLASPLAPGPRGLHPIGLNHSHINALVSPRNHLPPQSTYFFRAPPLNTVNSNQSNLVNSSNVVAVGNPGFHPVPGPPVMMEFAEATAQNSTSRNRSNVLSHQQQKLQQKEQHYLQLQQQHQHQHQSLGALTKATSLVTGLPPPHQQQQQQQPLHNLSQHVSVISKATIPTTGQPSANAATATTNPPLRPQIQKAPAVPMMGDATAHSSGHHLPPAALMASSVQPQVLTPVVQNPQPTTTKTPVSPESSVPINENAVQSHTATTTTTSFKMSETKPPPTPGTPPLKSPLETSFSSIPETVKEVTSTLSVPKPLLPSISFATNDKKSLLTADSPEPMDLSRTSPTSSKQFQNNKKDLKNENKNDSTDDNKNKKCDCNKCSNKEKPNNNNDENEDEDNDDEDDDEEEENDNESNENEDENEDENEEDENEDENEEDENGDEIDESEDENVQVDSDDDESYFLYDIEKRKNFLKDEKTSNKSNENINNSTFKLTHDNIPTKKIKLDYFDSINLQKKKTSNKNCNRTLSLQSQSFFRSYKKHTLRRSFSLDLSTTTKNSYSQNEPAFLPLSSPEVLPSKYLSFSESVKNNYDKTNGTSKNNNQTFNVNSGNKRKLESILPQLPLSSTSTTATTTTTSTTIFPATEHKVRHFETLNVKCLLDNCPETFKKLEELDKHLVQHHCILPHRCVMQGCSLSFSSTYELGRHYRMDHQGDGIKVWQCSKCGMKSKGNHYLLKHMYNYHYEGLFKCAKTNCDYQAKFRQSVVNHYRRNHLLVSERYEATAAIQRAKQSKGQQMTTQQCPLEGCQEILRSGELPLRRHLDLVHNRFALSRANLPLSSFSQAPNQQQPQLFFRLPDSPAAANPATSTMAAPSFPYSPSATFFPAPQFVFTEEQQQRELVIAAAAAAAAAANSSSSSSSTPAATTTTTTVSKYASERNATSYTIISVNCTAESNCTVAATQPPMRSMEELERHLQTVHGILPFRCHLCTLSFSFVRELDVHLLEAHLGQIEWPCPRCDHKRKSHHALANHVFKFHHSGAFACPVPQCGHISALRIEAIRHFNRLHCEYACKVDGCGRIFKAKECLRAHEAADHAVGGGGSSAAGSDAGTEGGGSSDQQQQGGGSYSSSGAASFLCNTCGKPFSTKGNLKTHQRIHLGVKPFRCRFSGCGKAFRAKEHLTIHERTHSGIKPYRCTWPECGHQTTDRSSMIAHVRGFHFRLPYKLKEQKERNIVDDRDPRQFVEVLPELLKYESFIHVLTG